MEVDQALEVLEGPSGDTSKTTLRWEVEAMREIPVFQADHARARRALGRPVVVVKLGRLR